MLRCAVRAGIAGVASIVLAAGAVHADAADEAVLTACRANPELAAVPRAAEIGCACAVDAMAALSPAEKQAIADDGFRPEGFATVADQHPGLLQTVRDCLEGGDD